MPCLRASTGCRAIAIRSGALVVVICCLLLSGEKLQRKVCFFRAISGLYVKEERVLWGFVQEKKAMKDEEGETLNSMVIAFNGFDSLFFCACG